MQNWFRTVLVGVGWTLFSGGLAAGVAGHADEAPLSTTVTTACQVDRVVDGDTFYCTSGEKVRLIGIDAPEMSQAEFGRASRSALMALLPRNARVRLEGDVTPVDRYGRTLAYVWRGRTMVNEAMIRGGWALLYTVPPNVAYVARFRRAQEAARREQAGLWRNGGFDCQPSEHRKQRC